MKLEHIKELMKTLDQSNLQELSFRDGEIKLVLKKENKNQVVVPTISTQAPLTDAALAAPKEITQADIKEKPAENIEKEKSDLHNLESPLVGTFYRASSPEAAPYVEVGSKIKKGDPVCIIEAMKILNVIESEVSGVVEAIYVENSHFVEYKSKILAIRKS